MEKKFNSVMVDLETLGVGVDAVVLSIGAVEFNIETGEMGRKFKTNISIDDSIKNGCVVEGNTVNWWFSQNKKAQTNLVFDQKSYFLAFSSFQLFLKTINFNEIWAKSPQFDLEKIKFNFKKLGLEIPWNYSQERCVRTHLRGFEDFVKGVTFDNLVEHSSIDDCIKQIIHCCAVEKRKIISEELRNNIEATYYYFVPYKNENCLVKRIISDGKLLILNGDYCDETKVENVVIGKTYFIKNNKINEIISDYDSTELRSVVKYYNEHLMFPHVNNN